MKVEATRVVSKLKEAGHEASFVGGSVRDMLLKRDIHDYDIATSATISQIKRLFPQVLEVGRSFGVCLVTINGHDFQVATYRRDGSYSDSRHPDSITITSSMEEDACRRDFTCNAMYYDPIEDRLIDYFKGTEHLKTRELVAVGNPHDRIKEDKLRMLRAIRFVCSYGFSIEKELWSAIGTCSEQVKLISPDRIRIELLKILSIEPVVGITLLNKTGILKHILPEVFDTIGCQQDPVWHPEGDVWTHTYTVMRHLKNLGASPALIFTGMLHDIGKVKHQQISKREDGSIKISNKDHDIGGAIQAEEICKRLNFSVEEREKVVNLIRFHMKAHFAKEMNKKTLIGFMRDLQNKGILEDQILLEHADSLRDSGDVRSNYLDDSTSQLSFYRSQEIELKEVIETKCFINGGDLIGLGLQAGPAFKEILVAVREAQDEGSITNKAEAMSFAKSKMEVFKYPLETNTAIKEIDEVRASTQEGVTEDEPDYAG